MKESKKRSFIIDYGCSLPYGHNLYVVNLFLRREEKKNSEVKAIICRSARRLKDVDRAKFCFLLPNLYMTFLSSKVNNQCLLFCIKVIRLFSITPLPRICILDLRARYSTKRIFKKYQFRKDDLIIYPSADYYGTRAFLLKLSRMRIEDRPRVHLRFIGVYESVHSYFNDKFTELINIINKNSETLSVSAEVPVYARYLNSLIQNISVKTEPFPIECTDLRSRIKKKGNETTFTILLPGSNRRCKGYFDIFNLAKEILFEFPMVKLIVQDMKQQTNHFNMKYRKKLKNLVNVQLLNAVLPRVTYEELYENTNLVLLPYCPNTYHYRGSGVHYEAIQYRVPVLARKGVGFAEEIEQWSSGWTYETKQDLFFCLRKIMALDAGHIDEKMGKAFLKFKKNSDEANNYNLS